MTRGTGWLRRAGRRWRCERGQGLVEYALILAVASVGMGVALLLLRDSLGDNMAQTGNRIDSVSSSGLTGVIAGSPGGSSSGTASGAPSGGSSQTPATPSDGGSSGNQGNSGNGNNGQHGNGKGNSGQGNGNGGPNGRKD
jgi:Flp pilus assembly pilin Flp